MWWTPLRIDGALVATTSVRQTANELAAPWHRGAQYSNVLYFDVSSVQMARRSRSSSKALLGQPAAHRAQHQGALLLWRRPMLLISFLLQALDWREATFEQLKSKLGVDVMAPTPRPSPWPLHCVQPWATPTTRGDSR